MTRFMHRYLFVILLSLVLLMGKTMAVDARTLVVAADVWCPYNCEPEAELQGYLLDVLRAVFSPLGIQIEYRVMPWTRALVETERGLVDAAVGVVRGNHGRNLIGEEPLGRDETVLIVRAGEEFQFSRPQDLDDMAIGVIAGYSYDGLGPFDAYLAIRHVEDSDIYIIHHDQPLQSLFSMLGDGRIDVFPENRYVATYAIRQLGLEQSVSLLDTGLGDDIFVAFTPDSEGEAHLTILDEGVRRLRDSGQFADILTRYGLEETR